MKIGRGLGAVAGMGGASEVAGGQLPPCPMLCPTGVVR